MKIMSIDPGRGGALVVLEDLIPTTYYGMPIQKVKAKERVDHRKIAEILYKENPERVVVEHVGSSPQMGTASAFDFGYSFSAILGVCAGAEYPCHLITPQRWKTYHGLLNKPKDESRLLVIRKFQDQANRFKYKNSVDTCDAILMGIAWWELGGEKVMRYLNIGIEVITQTAMAVLVSDRIVEVWLPKSQIDDGAHNDFREGSHITICLPEWLAEDKGLI